MAKAYTPEFWPYTHAARAHRLSQILNITLDDAVSLVTKFGAAVESAVKVSKSAQ